MDLLLWTCQEFKRHYLLSILWNVVLEMPFIFGTSVELWDIADVTFTYMLTLKKSK